MLFKWLTDTLMHYWLARTHVLYRWSKQLEFWCLQLFSSSI